MVTELNSVGQSIKINHEGKWHELVVRTRGDGLAPEHLSKVTGRTILKWMAVWSAIQADDMHALDDTNAPIQSLFDEDGDIVEVSEPVEPHCTVFNKDWNGLSVTVHSNDNGVKALEAYAGQNKALDTLRQHMPKLFQASAPQAAQQPTAPGNVTTTAQGQSAQDSYTVTNQLPNAWIRRTKQGLADGLLAIEGGKADNPTFSTQAKLADKPYDSKANQYPEKTIVMYELLQGGIADVKDYNGTMFLSIQTTDGQDIAIWQRDDTTYEGKTIQSDWNKALGRMGFKDSSPQVGQQFVIGADYIAMKAGKVTTDNNGNEIQYKNFYGFFSAPERS